MAREGHRFEFGWLGVLGMFVIFTAGSAVIFFLGIYVGKGLQESRLAREERVVRLPVSPQADGGYEGALGGDLRPYDQLAQSQAPATASVNLAVRSAVEPTPTPEPLPEATAPPSPLAEASPPAVAATPGIVLHSPAATEQLARLEPVPTPPARVGGKVWSVQVNATKDEATANRLVRRLEEIGYDAFIVRVRLANETWYRVRVGRFPTMEAATAVVMRLKNEERYSRAFLVNE